MFVCSRDYNLDTHGRGHIRQEQSLNPQCLVRRARYSTVRSTDVRAPLVSAAATSPPISLHPCPLALPTQKGPNPQARHTIRSPKLLGAEASTSSTTIRQYWWCPCLVNFWTPDRTITYTLLRDSVPESKPPAPAPMSRGQGHRSQRHKHTREHNGNPQWHPAAY